MTAAEILERLFERIDVFLDDDSRPGGNLVDRVKALQARHDEMCSIVRSTQRDYERAKLLGLLER